MSWAIEENIEDCIKSYLQNNISGVSLNYYSAWSSETIKYPAVIVNAVESRNVEKTGWTGIREVDVVIGLLVAADSSVRSNTASYRDKIITALAYDDLASSLNQVSGAKVVFSQANIEEIKRDIDENRRVFVNEIRLAVVASPKQT